MNALAREPKVVERGPNWLFVRVPAGGLDERGPQAATLSERLWKLCLQHFTYRIVLELQDVKEIDDQTTEELRELRSKLIDQGGALRLCGLPKKCSKKLLNLASHGVLADHESRHDAVCGDSGDWSKPQIQAKANKQKRPKAKKPQRPKTSG